jgi:uncharacterized protein (DUF362 family)
MNISLSRRHVLTGAAAAGLVASAPIRLVAGPAPTRARVVVMKEADRARAVTACLDGLAFTGCKGRDVAIKANFNSDDAFPASTHPATLAALLAALRAGGAGSVTVGERSGMGDTRTVLERTGGADAVRAAGGKVVVLDDVAAAGWQAFQADHWPAGFHAARLFTESPCVVQTMCCKTHRFGGHVTLSLKNTVGLVAKRVPGNGHDYMRDLHGSRHQRAMIAEANLAWRPALNVMDCLEAFVDGGPERGSRVAPGVFLASEDRCALDAAAIALLRLHGMKGPASRGPIGRTEQLARAVELGVGAAPAAVEVVPADEHARDIARRLADQLAAG